MPSKTRFTPRPGGGFKAERFEMDLPMEMVDSEVCW